MNARSYIVALPDVALEKIFSFLTYDQIAKNREVCKRFNEVGGKYLSRGFVRVEKRHSAIYKRLKSLLPRRESERRVHPLAKHCELLAAIETRISMLNMTFSRYIEGNLCCFIPGKVIDEIERVLRVVEAKGQPPRTHELLQELRDISSMAMEYFEEHILPKLKQRIEQPLNNIIPLLPSTTSKASKYILVDYAIAMEVRKMKKVTRLQRVKLDEVSTQLNKLERKVKRHNLKLKAQAIKIRHHERKLQDQATKMHEQEVIIADLRKHIDEFEQKFSALTAEVRGKDEGHRAAKNDAVAPVPILAPAKFHLSNIKPRRAQVLHNGFAVFQADLERKRRAIAPVFEMPNKLPRNSSVEIAHSAISVEVGITEKSDGDDSRPLAKGKSDLQTFTCSVIDSLLGNPITGIKPRKRKIAEPIDFN